MFSRRIKKCRQNQKCESANLSASTQKSETVADWFTVWLFRQRFRMTSQKMKSARKSVCFFLEAGISARSLMSILILCLFLPQDASAMTGLASWYSTEACQFNKSPKCPTASGERLHELIKSKKSYAANWGSRLGSAVHIRGIETGRSASVVVRDRGPAKRLKSRIIDLDRDTFIYLCGSAERGLCKVEVTE